MDLTLDGQENTPWESDGCRSGRQLKNCGPVT